MLREQPVIRSLRWPFMVTLTCLILLYAVGGTPDGWFPWGLVPFVGLIALAVICDISVTVDDRGLRRRRAWHSSCIPWDEIDAVECLVKSKFAGGKRSMLTIRIHSNRDGIRALHETEWSVAVLTRALAKRQSTELVAACRSLNVPARLRDWPGPEDSVAIPQQWW